MSINNIRGSPGYRDYDKIEDLFESSKNSPNVSIYEPK